MEKYIPTPEEFAQELADIRNEYLEQKDDEELCHIFMDDYMTSVLNALGYEKGVAIFDNTKKWYA